MHYYYRRSPGLRQQAMHHRRTGRTAGREQLQADTGGAEALATASRQGVDYRIAALDREQALNRGAWDPPKAAAGRRRQPARIPDRTPRADDYQ
jgi:hypothetical protein